jgi:hypothetical protein
MQDRQELLVQLDHLAPQELTAQMELTDYLALQVQLGRLELQDHRVKLDRLVLLEPMELTVCPALMDFQVFKDLQEHQAYREPTAQMERTDSQVLTVPLELMALQVQMDCQELTELSVQLVLLERMGLSAQLALPDLA